MVPKSWGVKSVQNFYVAMAMGPIAQHLADCARRTRGGRVARPGPSKGSASLAEEAARRGDPRRRPAEGGARLLVCSNCCQMETTTNTRTHVLCLNQIQSSYKPTSRNVFSRRFLIDSRRRNTWLGKKELGVQAEERISVTIRIPEEQRNINATSRENGDH